jgi:hypothetical protein
MVRIWIPRERPQNPLSEMERMARLHHALQMTVSEGSITEREAVCLMQAGLRTMLEDWVDDE